MVYSNQPRKPIFCTTCEKKGVKTEISFNKHLLGKSGKPMPLDAKTKQPHNCPFREQKAAKVVEIGSITSEIKTASIAGIVIKTEDSRIVNKKDGTTAIVQEVIVGDSSGEIQLVLWETDAGTLREGDAVSVTNGYVTEYNGSLRISKGKFGTLSKQKAA